MNYKKPKKAIITDAGFASRYLPITKTIPKAMIPIGAKPVMQLCVEELRRRVPSRRRNLSAFIAKNSLRTALLKRRLRVECGMRRRRKSMVRSCTSLLFTDSRLQD